MKKLLCLMMCFVLLFSTGTVALAQRDTSLIMGDVDGNGKVQAEDARLALRASVGLTKIESGTNVFAAADINHDGHIGPDDARSILRASVGLESLSGKNEFDYLRYGCFYLQGTMTDSSGEVLPLEMAVTPNSVYMISDFEGITMGMLINGDTTYMIYPAEKAYLELSSPVLKAMGMSSDDMISTANLDYSQYDLDKADAKLTENVNGVNCTVYVYNNSSGSTRFYMNGDKLVRFATYDANGIPDAINDIDYITDLVPPDKIDPPDDYTGYKGLTGMFRFVELLGDVVGE